MTARTWCSRHHRVMDAERVADPDGSYLRCIECRSMGCTEPDKYQDDRTYLENERALDQRLDWHTGRREAANYSEAKRLPRRHIADVSRETFNPDRQMKLPRISEEERAEIHIALLQRKKALQKLEKDTDAQEIPPDRIRERLRLYDDSEQLIMSRKVPIAGLLTLFADEPDLSAEGRAARDNAAEGPDLWSGIEVGGGIPASKTSDRWKGGIEVPEPGVEPEIRENRLLTGGGKCKHGIYLADPCPECEAEATAETADLLAAAESARCAHGILLGEPCGQCDSGTATGVPTEPAPEPEGPSSGEPPQIPRGETWKDPRSDPEPGVSGGGVGPEPTI